ncbi:tRNA U34 5-methylaminomethyl-2-thiouridine-forming methyltransferase MnmC [Rhizobium sp. RU20A]|uniref:tRNA (5-methylaminomethyl-2-thiouridine)(34)-methyltransferase MnmD n=1 Tax=Rhizobium sp. RU20A TaxID=1907412 RepID=UPI0009558720|nr:tRNA (5-methylaminomethyl-2-thiouridine)(34)-methyltransferase MnmD [Rhizobium sp. RU20A]SIQ29233.1 tRNA U34 5-methylaminomethyl-2-thiouridine-forming methyltransferase MnmC [Rhizobium sp. RU20A]
MQDTESPTAEPTVETHAPLTWHAGDMPYSPAFSDHFYCREDGRAECGHVFLAGNGLPERWQAPRPFAIGELGFGTGLNFCETLRQWRLTKVTGASLSFTSFERYPMTTEEIGRALSRWPEIDRERQELVACWPATPSGHVTLTFADDVTLTVVCGDVLETLPAWQAPMDAWYLDGFAPSRNPAMWSIETLTRVHDRTRRGGRFGTYAAAGFVRRNLQAAGFAVERRKGYAGKREMLCGERPSSPPLVVD